MRLKLNINNIILYLKIKGYVLPTDNWDDEWCDVEVTLESRFLKYTFGSEILLSCEVDSLEEYLAKLFNDKMTCNTTMECIEPDLEFAFYPKCDLRNDPKFEYVKEGYEIADISMKIIVHFWNDAGCMTDNSLHLTLGREEIEYLHTYLLLVKRVINKSDESVRALVEKEIFLPDYKY